jgi:hypothetical protein
MTDSLCHLCLGAPSAHRVAGYSISVCKSCWQAAERGWPKQWEDTLFAALGRAGLLIPDRNRAGRLPREYQPPSDFAL